jgi:hypothetical protein
MKRNVARHRDLGHGEQSSAPSATLRGLRVKLRRDGADAALCERNRRSYRAPVNRCFSSDNQFGTITS